MTKLLMMIGTVVLVLAAPAWADPLAIAKAHDDAFDRATWNGGCDPQKGLSFYDKNAIAIYPGEGEVADTPDGIQKLIKNFVAPFCGEGQKKPKVTNHHIRALSLGPDYIIIIRSADVEGEAGKATRVRATELIHRSGGRWRYLVDHASIGAPPEPANASAKPGDKP